MSKRKTINDPNDSESPKVGGEFVTTEGDWRGQTVQVESETKLDADTGTGPTVILRTFEFRADPITFKNYKKKNGHLPYAQEIFQSHINGIKAMLWQDGLRPAEEIEPRMILSKNKEKYLIIVGAVPQLGQIILERPKTLMEIANPNETRTDSDKVSRVL